MSSDTPATETKPKKGKGLIVKLLLGIGLIGAGGGGVFALVQSGMIGEHGEEKKEKDLPKLVRKGEEDPYAPKSRRQGRRSAALKSRARAAANTAPSITTSPRTSRRTSRARRRWSRCSLACSTRRDGRVLMWLKKHELAIRSAMLAVLADTPEEDVDTIAGKERMQQRLTAAINKVLTETEGFGGVDTVYFKAFLVQYEARTRLYRRAGRRAALPRAAARGGACGRDTAARLGAVREPLARALAAALAPLTGDEPPEVRCGEVARRPRRWNC